MTENVNEDETAIGTNSTSTENSGNDETDGNDASDEQVNIYV